MKAEDLMVGDFARVNRDGLCIKKDTIVEIRGVNSDEKLPEKNLVGFAACRPLDGEQFECGIWCEYLSPIQLTLEIFEKNRWWWDGVYAILRYDESAYLSYYKHEGILRDFREGRDGVDIIFQSRPGLNYVHELQHALHSCRIDKEIEL